MTGLVLAAAGSGTRFGSSVPKQFLSLDGRPLYQVSLLRFAPLIDEAVVVVPVEWVEPVGKELGALRPPCRAFAVAGGPQRQDSVYRGLTELSEAVTTVLVHDAARPYVSTALIAAVLETAVKTGACVPGLAPADTVKEVGNAPGQGGDEATLVSRTLDREAVRLIQTPQGFDRALLKRAIETAIEAGFQGTDESTLVERLGVPVHVVPGEPGNVKVTWREQLPSGADSS